MLLVPPVFAGAEGKAVRAAGGGQRKKRHIMASYMMQFGLTSETWSKIMSDPEAYRGDNLRCVVEGLGGRVKDMWFTSGGHDGHLG